MRLRQLSRKIGVPLSQIHTFLKEKNYALETDSNSKLTEEQEQLIKAHFHYAKEEDDQQITSKPTEIAPDIKEIVQESTEVAPDIKEIVQESTEVAPDIKEIVQEPTEVAPDIKEIVQEPTEVAPDIKEIVQEPTEVAPDIKEIVQEPTEVAPDIKEIVQEPTEVAPDIKEIVQEPTEVAPDIKEIVQEPTEVAPDIKEIVQEPTEVAPDIKEIVQEPTEILTQKVVPELVEKETFATADEKKNTAEAKPSGEGTNEVIRAAKQKLEGLKVVGKINLQKLNVKESLVVENIDTEPPIGKVKGKPVHKKIIEQRHTNQKGNNNKRSQKRTLTLEEKEAKKQRAIQRKNKQLKETQKQLKAAHYESKMRERKFLLPKKNRSKSSKNIEQDPEEVAVLIPKTIFGKFMRWLNT